MPRMRLVFFISLFALAATAVEPRGSVPACWEPFRNLGRQTALNTYVIQDTRDSRFHVTGHLRADGTLSLGILTGLSNGARSTIDVSRAVRECLNHFEGRVSAVEVILSKHAVIDDATNTLSTDPQLDAFNTGWNRANDSLAFQFAKRTDANFDESAARASRAALATEVGRVITSYPGLTQVTLQGSLGREGDFILVNLRFSRARR